MQLLVTARPTICRWNPCKGLRHSPSRTSFRTPALGDKPSGEAPARPDVSSTEQPDFWEGESFELLGQISSYALPIFVVLALCVGFFASSTYNNDADVFLDSPRSDQDTAKLYKFE